MTRSRRAMWMLALPAASAVASLSVGGTVWKVAVAGSGAAIVALYGAARGDRRQRLLAAGLAASAVGDYVLAEHGGDPGGFLAGVAAFACAHAGYVTWSVRNGGVHWALLAGFGCATIAWFALGLLPAMGASVLSAALLGYAALSLLTLSSAAALRLDGMVRAAFATGIALLVLSDVCIALSRFQGIARAGDFVLPLYYSAQGAVTATGLLATGRRPTKGAEVAVDNHGLHG